MPHQWYILQNGKKYGPYSEEHMHSFISEGRLKGGSLVWCEGMKGWARAADVEPFRSHFAIPQARPPERPAPPARPAITSERRGGGRKAAGALVVVIIVAGLGIWWIYPQLSGQQQSEQPTQTGPAYGEAEGTLYTAYQEGVHDGDTIYVSVPLTLANPEIQSEISDPRWTSFAPIRFAMVDTPEVYPDVENGALEAKNFVKQLIADGGNRVYLDLDNDSRSQTGKRFRDVDDNRLVAVVYVYINSKLVNVNAEVLRFWQENFPSDNWVGYTSDIVHSEFNPSEWLSPSYPYVR